MKHPAASLLYAAAVIVLASAVAFSQFPFDAQIQYRRGQDVVPVYEGWAPNPDGTFSLFFGYMNRNYQEQLDIPLGPNNTIEPGGDRGQPEHFYPRRQSFVFKVVVPKDWGVEKKVGWTLSIRGKTNTAKGWLHPEWEIDKEIMMQNSDDEGSSDPLNQPPTITGSAAQTATVNGAVSLTATAEDDGRPKGRNSGLSIRWIQYRGPAAVSINSDPGQSVAGKPLTSTAKAVFTAPGAYVLRAIATDASLQTPLDINVTVK